LQASAGPQSALVEHGTPSALVIFVALTHDAKTAAVSSDVSARINV
jgi:hypothetical protein